MAVHLVESPAAEIKSLMCLSNRWDLMHVPPDQKVKPASEMYCALYGKYEIFLEWDKGYFSRSALGL